MIDPTDPVGAPTKGHKPLSATERNDWNDFIKYLYEQHLYGNRSLDDRNTNQGRQAMAEYIKNNPGTTVNYDIVPRVQYEFQYLKQNGKLPGGEDLGMYGKMIQSTINKSNPKLSPVDGWLGSLTSTQVFPVFTSPDNKQSGTNYGQVKNYTDKYIADNGMKFQQ